MLSFIHLPLLIGLVLAHHIDLESGPVKLAEGHSCLVVDIVNTDLSPDGCGSSAIRWLMHEGLSPGSMEISLYVIFYLSTQFRQKLQRKRQGQDVQLFKYNLEKNK